MNEMEKIQARIDHTEKLKPLMGLGPWTSQVEKGTVDWDELIDKLERALAAAKEIRG